MTMNGTQRRHLRESLAHLERQLEAIEAVLKGAGRPGLFPRWSDDLDPSERVRQLAAVARVRAAMAAVMAAQGLEAEAPPLGARQALQSQWALAEIGLEELGARAMRGYGELNPEQEIELERLVASLQGALPRSDGDRGAGAAPESSLGEALAAATAAAMEAMARALAAATLAGREREELPLIAGDALAAVARAVCVKAGIGGALPEFQIDGIRWRLDPPRLQGLGADYVAARYRRQLAGLEGAVRTALRSYGVAAARAG
ncbi:MAG: hypothetical protein ACRD1E_04635 [Terriglobales bacterium]